MNRKGLISLGQVSAVIMILVTVGIMLVVGLRVENTVQDDFTANTVEWNAARDTMEGLANVSENQGLLGTIIVFGVILGVVVALYAWKEAGF